MIKINGFTLLEIIAALVIIGILATVAITKLNDNEVESMADTAIIKSSLRQTIMRAMSDVSTANWNISVSNKIISIKKDTTPIVSHDLQEYEGTFTINFNELGQPQSSPILPYSITIDSETGYVQ